MVKDRLGLGSVGWGGCNMVKDKLGFFGGGGGKEGLEHNPDIRASPKAMCHFKVSYLLDEFKYVILSDLDIAENLALYS